METKKTNPLHLDWLNDMIDCNFKICMLMFDKILKTCIMIEILNWIFTQCILKKLVHVWFILTFGKILWLLNVPDDKSIYLLSQFAACRNCNPKPICYNNAFLIWIFRFGRCLVSIATQSKFKMNTSWPLDVRLRRFGSNQGNGR